MSTITTSKLGGQLTFYDNVNFSTAKQKFSFGKGDRFPRQKKIISDQIQYELPGTFGRRAPSFGFGDRFEFIKQAETPGPDSYRVSSEFEGGHNSTSYLPKKQAFSFGISREAYEKVYIPSRKFNPDKCIPGPGAYSLNHSIGYDAKKFSLQGRTPYC
eukprot:CAMPEP_0170542222 /NCGR_PEP_ID=MMETSP0211-20121228/1720_1 /TAXON_ID=311385 /ORGANISM="Pseudokeronopsis sp., Strain OXSARD2" /LENGTH=157 /DNA_ID=CAMNT_0010845217 /DNA_START=17 /DNA_END=490 /DNA_ORIENTATION=-